MRMPSNGFYELRELGLDGIATISRSKMGLQAPLRQIRYRKHKNDYSLVTTLLDSRISRGALCELYGARWGIEEFFKTLKQVGKIEQLHARSKNGILQEIYAFLLLQTMTALVQNSGNQPRRKKKKGGTPYKGTVKYNHTLALTITSQLSPFLLQTEIQKCQIIALQKLLLLGRYNAYGGRHFPRTSYKPSARWRCTKKKTARLGRQPLGS
jgi:hypothetical protein